MDETVLVIKEVTVQCWELRFPELSQALCIRRSRALGGTFPSQTYILNGLAKKSLDFVVRGKSSPGPGFIEIHILSLLRSSKGKVRAYRGWATYTAVTSHHQQPPSFWAGTTKGDRENRPEFFPLMYSHTSPL